MRIHRLAMNLTFLALVGAAACDQASPDDALEIEVSAHPDSVAIAEAALEALDSEEVQRPEFWLAGLKAGSVDLGSWSCIPPPLSNCKKVGSELVCNPMPVPELP